MLNKSEAKQSHDQLTHNLDSQNHLVVYSNGSGIIDKIGAADVSLRRIIYKAFFDSSQGFTVYSGELQGIQ